MADWCDFNSITSELCGSNYKWLRISMTGHVINEEVQARIETTRKLFIIIKKTAEIHGETVWKEGSENLILTEHIKGMRSRRKQ